MGDETQELDLEVGIEDTTTDETTDETSEETTDEEALTGDTDTDTDEDDEDGEKKIPEPPIFKDVNKAFPELFKKFPGLRHAFFHEREYRKAFPTVEEAQEAAEDLQGLRQLESSLTSGDVGELTSTLKTIENMGEDVLPNLANNFLPALQKSNPEAYYTAITPIMANFCRSLYNNGMKNDNENLKNAGLLAAQMLFDDMKVATGETKVGSGPKPKDTTLENERKSFKEERYTSLLNDVSEETNNTLGAAIKKGFDPKSMTDSMQDMLTERITKEVNRVLRSDPTYMSQINSLWKKAANENFSSSYKTKIVTAYLRRANEVMPSIRSKIRSTVLGSRSKSGNSTGKATDTNERKEPLNTTGGGHSKKSDLKNIDPKTVDWSKTTDKQYLKGEITFKK